MFKKGFWVTVAVLGLMIVLDFVLVENFKVKAADGSYNMIAVNELPGLRDDTILQNLTIYAAPDASADCKNTLALLLAETPPALLPPYLDIELRSAPPTEFHGLSSKNTIKLNCALPGPRLREVFFHELGHVHYWTLSREQKAIFEERSATYTAAGAPNYLTEYATVNADEDFADSFMIYMTRRGVFEAKAEKSATLSKKYESIDSYFETFTQ